MAQKVGYCGAFANLSIADWVEIRYEFRQNIIEVHCAIVNGETDRRREKCLRHRAQYELRIRIHWQDVLHIAKTPALADDSVSDSDTVVITAVNRPYCTTSSKYYTTEKLQQYKAVLQPYEYSTTVQKPR
jgi:16S rRNA A1518/A1519 N6-dimethyltransferase RsmA/KsgA/DIM1 with predicted DNA glycosylase/AP lyase activity